MMSTCVLYMVRSIVLVWANAWESTYVEFLKKHRRTKTMAARNEGALWSWTAKLEGRVRDQPSPDGDTFASISEGFVVNVVETQGDWIRIQDIWSPPEEQKGAWLMFRNKKGKCMANVLDDQSSAEVLWTAQQTKGASSDSVNLGFVDTLPARKAAEPYDDLKWTGLVAAVQDLDKSLADVFSGTFLGKYIDILDSIGAETVDDLATLSRRDLGADFDKVQHQRFYVLHQSHR